MSNFWNNLPRPFFALAPMEDVTDTVFRQVLARAARPDVFFTEFMNVDGFCHPVGRMDVARRLVFTSAETPIVAQIWGKDPAKFRQTAAAIARLGFAGIDINMGCPDKAVVKTGGGAALIKNPELAREIIASVKSCEHFFWRSPLLSTNGADRATGSPPSPSLLSKLGLGMGMSPGSDRLGGTSASEKVVHNFSQAGVKTFAISVKTRLGYSSIDEWQSWLTSLLALELDALSVHLRTKLQLSQVPAHHKLMPDIIQLRDQLSPQTRLIFNGDIADRAAGERLAAKYPGIDGIMIGRGVFQNPFCFEPTPRHHSPAELIDLLKYHLSLTDASQNYPRLKKFFKIYINNFPGAKELRAQLMDTTNAQQALELLDQR